MDRTNRFRATLAVLRQSVSAIITVSITAVVCVACTIGAPPTIEVETIDFDTTGRYEIARIDSDLWFIEDTDITTSKDQQALIRFDLTMLAADDPIPLPGDTSWPDSKIIGNALYLVSLRVADDVPITGGFDFPHFYADRDHSDTVMTKIDLQTGQPIVQHPIGDFDQGLFKEHVFWFSDLGLNGLNLESGEPVDVNSTRGLPPGTLHETTDDLWFFADHKAYRVDPKTAEVMSEHFFGYEKGIVDQEVRLDGETTFWMSGTERDGPERTFKLDIPTDTLTEIDGPIPPDPNEAVFNTSLDDGDTRWEIPRGKDDNSTWTQIDNTTGKTLGEYRFEEFEPYFEYDGYMWLTNKPKIGRIPLADLQDLGQ